MKLTVVSPHRDDAAFSIGLAIGTWITSGHSVEVVNCFTESVYSPFGDLDSVYIDDLQFYVTGLRQREDALWSRQYDRPVVVKDLNLQDAPQRLQCNVDDVCSITPHPNDLASVTIRRMLTTTVSGALLLPLGLGNHVDHLTARRAAQDGWPEEMAIGFYEDLPYAARPGVVEFLTNKVAGTEAGLEPAFVGEVGDIATAIERKRELARCYDSQISYEVAEQIAGFCGQYGGRERLWVNRAWRQGGLGAMQ